MTVSDESQSVAELADADLVLRTRSGDAAAFGELWRRHYRSGITVARSITSSLDADDLVQEAYTKIYQSIQRGGGPTGSFRAYLFTSIRNTAAGWGRARKETKIDELESVEDPAAGEHVTDDALDRSLTHHAFRSLPTRWQEVLWYSEIEGMKPSEIAPLLGMKATAVAQLTFRAREGLREAWIQAHLRSVEDGSACQFTIERLGAWARGNLGRRDLAKVEAHLGECARCSIVASEADEVGSRLAMVLLPLAIGVAGTAGYLASVQGGTAAVIALAAMPSEVVDGAVVAGGSIAAPPVPGDPVGAGAVIVGGSGSAGTSSAGASSAGASSAGVGASGAGAGASAAGATAGSAATGGLLSGVGAMAGIAVAGVVLAGSVVAAAVVVPALTAPAVSSEGSSRAGATEEDAAGPAPAPTTTPRPSTPAPVVTPAPVTTLDPVIPPAPITDTPPPPAPAPAPQPAPAPTKPPAPPVPPAPTPAPTPTPEPTPTPTPTPTPEPTPTPTPSPVPGLSVDAPALGPGVDIGIVDDAVVFTVPVTGAAGAVLVWSFTGGDPQQVVLDNAGAASVAFAPTYADWLADATLSLRFLTDDGEGPSTVVSLRTLLAEWLLA